MFEALRREGQLEPLGLKAAIIRHLRFEGSKDQGFQPQALWHQVRIPAPDLRL